MTLTDQLIEQPTDLQLSVAMRDGSKAEHEAAEHSSYMSELLGGKVNEAGYAAYLQRLRVVYAAMEQVVRDRLADPMVAAVHDAALERLGAIDADLEHWSPGWVAAGAHVDSPAAEAYRDRILGAGWGGALVAHHYTRYLGDLSGGQVIGRMLDRTFDLDGAGVSFYAFPEIPKPKPYKDAYRARLDGLGLSAADVERVVDEVKVAFRMNQAMFTELGEHLPLFAR